MQVSARLEVAHLLFAKLGHRSVVNGAAFGVIGTRA